MRLLSRLLSAKLTAFLLPVAVCVSCATIPFEVPEADRELVIVEGHIYSACTGCEHLDGEDFMGNPMSWWDDIIEVKITSPKEYEGKLLELRNEYGNTIKEAWWFEGSRVTFELELQFLKSPYKLDDDSEHSVITYISQDIDKSLTSEQATAIQAQKEKNKRLVAEEKAHVVQLHDTLTTIAKQHGLTLEKLTEMNPNLDPRSLRVGQVLRIRW